MSNAISPALPTGDGNLQIDERSFLWIAELLHGESGIVLSPGKKNLVVSRLSRRLRELGLADFPDYCRHLEGANGGKERRKLVTALTTNVTRFFREGHHFETLDRELFPGLLARARQGGRVRIWSAGCSTGEEPYSIAIRLLEQMPDAAGHDIRILGTDIDADVIARARAATYADIDEDHLPRALRDRWFVPSDATPGALQVAPAVRALVSLAELNLMQDWPMRGPFDVIFCRNVVIYFDADTQARLWSRFADMLAPGGRLFLGHSERVNTAVEPRLAPAGITQYRRL